MFSLPFVFSIEEYSNLPQNELIGKDLPEYFNFFVGNERIVLHVEGKEKLKVSLVTKNNKIINIEYSEINNPTLNIYAEKQALLNLISSEDPINSFIQAIEKKKIKLNGVGILKNMKFSMVPFLLKSFTPKKVEPTYTHAMISSEDSCTGSALDCVKKYVRASQSSNREDEDEDSTMERWREFFEEAEESIEEAAEDESTICENTEDCPEGYVCAPLSGSTEKVCKSLEEYVIREDESSSEEETNKICLQNSSCGEGQFCNLHGGRIILLGTCEDIEARDINDLIREILGGTEDEPEEPTEEETEPPEEPPLEEIVDPNTDPVVLFPSPTGKSKLLIVNDLDPIPDLGLSNWIVRVRIASTQAQLNALSSEVLEARTEPGSDLSWLCGLDGALIANIITPDSSKREVDPATLTDPETIIGFIADKSYLYFEIPEDMTSYYLRVHYGRWDPSGDFRCFRKAIDFVRFCEGTWIEKGFDLPISEHAPGTVIALKMSAFVPDGEFLGAEQCTLYGF